MVYILRCVKDRKCLRIKVSGAVEILSLHLLKSMLADKRGHLLPVSYRDRDILGNLSS